MFDLPFLPERASTLAADVDALYLFAVVLSAFFTILIFAGVLYLMVKYRRRSESEHGDPIHGSLVLEVIWSVIPFIICMGLFAWGAQVFYKAYDTPADAREYLATGKQWMWKLQHPEGHREINTLHVPVNTPIKLTMTSEDVIHSFFVPAFRVKQDVVPGRYSQVWFEATKTGRFHLFCTEYCGAEHSQMIGTVIVMEQDEYQEWLAGGLVGSTPVASGAALFQQYACGACHGAADHSRGPALEGLPGTEATLAGGRTVERDDNYLRESILRPSAKLVDGYQNLMPTYQGQISEEGVAHLIAYIKNLGTDESAKLLAGGGEGNTLASNPFAEGDDDAHSESEASDEAGH